MTQRLLVVPAAGMGTRLGGAAPKALVPVCGRPMLDLVVDRYARYVDRIVVIVNPAARSLFERWRRGRDEVTLIEQETATGMLDAILLARPALGTAASVWISWADQVGVLPSTAEQLARSTVPPAPALVLPTVTSENPYTHFERNAEGRIVRLLQRREGDAMPAHGESDMGVFALSAETFDIDLPAFAESVAHGRETGERNFLPFVPWLAARKEVVTFPCADPMEAIGINTQDDLRRMERWLSSR